ncbi:MAG: hypothetical protein ABI321_00990 [Polyangia bacterium]
MRLSATGHRIVRTLLFLMIAAGVGLAIHKTRRTDEQLELTHYVEHDLRPLVLEEQSIAEALSALFADKTLPPAAARHRLVDELNPRLIKLRRAAEALSPSTRTVRTLAAEYLRVVDAWTEAARTAVRAIDEPTLSTEAGMVAVHERLADAARASQLFSEHVVSTSRMHRLAGPQQ